MNRLHPAILIAVVFVISGCEPPSSNRLPTSVTTEVEGGAERRNAESLTRALDMLSRFNEFESEVVKNQALVQLASWAENLNEEIEWKQDDLVNRLPQDYKATPMVTDLGKMRFTIPDVDFVLEAIWLRGISRWATLSRADERMSAWLKEKETSGDPTLAQQLAIAERLFDWTIRNIQLDNLIPYPKDQVATPGQVGNMPNAPPPMRGIPGPGYQRLPGETLLYGHGDSWERARVFMLLARQHGIPSVMVSINEDFAARARPWAVGILLGDNLYLFDLELGLPIPGADGNGIATLAELRAHPEILRTLDLDDERKYGVAETDLKKLVGFLEASPYALSRRMATVEAKLAGEQQLNLVTRPSEIAERLQKIGGLNTVQIWSVGCEAVAFSYIRKKQIKEDPAAAAANYFETGVFLKLNPLLQGRHLHLRGNFETVDSVLGAKGQYLASRTNRDQLAALGTSEEAQRALGVFKGKDEDERIFRMRLDAMKTLITQTKFHATYWLGLTQYETSNYASAIEWFRQRILEAAPESPWTTGARYNLARCYELTGEVDKARDLLFVDDSPQRHGNILRARRLKK